MSPHLCGNPISAPIRRTVKSKLSLSELRLWPLVWLVRWTVRRLNRVLVLLNSLAFKKADKQSASRLFTQVVLAKKEWRPGSAQRARWPEVTNPETRPTGSPDTCRLFRSDLAGRLGVSTPRSPTARNRGTFNSIKFLSNRATAVLLRYRLPSAWGGVLLISNGAERIEKVVERRKQRALEMKLRGPDGKLGFPNVCGSVTPNARHGFFPAHLGSRRVALLHATSKCAEAD
jgi:hypothetical protein